MMREARRAAGAISIVVAVAAAGAGHVGPAAWREARWGMTVEQLLAAFPGEAVRLEPEERLADGNVVAAGIERWVDAGQPFRVRFIFADGKLALVSLRSPVDQAATAASYEQLRKLLAERLGAAGEETTDDAFIDLRQTRWRAGESRVDLKYIPGVVVVLYSPWAAPR